jgi:acid phosphatase type 7
MLKHYKINFFILLLTLIFCACSSNIIKDDADWSFVAIGDVRSGYGIYNKLAKTIARYRPDPEFVVVLGDIIPEPGNEFEWQKFLSYSRPITLSIKMYTVVGNHDVNSPETEQIYKEQADMPGNRLYYSFVNRNVCFIILDTQIPGETKAIIGDQYNWLIDSLNTASNDGNIDKIIIFMHHPFYPQGHYKGDNLIDADNLHAKIESFSKVILIMESHEHQFFYYKKNNIHHLITGGGGAPLYDEVVEGYFHFTKVGFYEKENRINIKTVGTFGETIQDFNL